MPKSLFLPAPAEAQLLAYPRGPLKQVKPEVLFAPEVLRRAWLRVKAAGGGAGVDGMTIEQFETNLEANLAELQKEVLSGRYRPRPVKRLLAPKPNGGLRPLALWTLRDKIVQRVVLDCIEPYFERHFLPCSFGFRPGRSIAQVVEVVVAQRQAHRRWVANIDIKDCFDSLDLELLLHFVRQQVTDPLILKLLKSWLNARIFNELSGQRARAGASQGAVISPLLSNVYLHQVDVLLTQQQYALVRYADNMIICCRQKSEAEQALQTAAAALQQVRLEINPHKSGVVHFDQGFQFLGVFFLRNEFFNL